jgi:hypothetical protein
MRGFHELMSFVTIFTVDIKLQILATTIFPSYSAFISKGAEKGKKSESTGWILKNLEIEAWP